MIRRTNSQKPSSEAFPNLHSHASSRHLLTRVFRYLHSFTSVFLIHQQIALLSWWTRYASVSSHVIVTIAARGAAGHNWLSALLLVFSTSALPMFGACESFALHIFALEDCDAAFDRCRLLKLSCTESVEGSEKGVHLRDHQLANAVC